MKVVPPMLSYSSLKTAVIIKSSQREKMRSKTNLRIKKWNEQRWTRTHCEIKLYNRTFYDNYYFK